MGVERLHAAEREARRLEPRVDAALGDIAAEARKELRARRAELKEIPSLRNLTAITASEMFLLYCVM